MLTAEFAPPRALADPGAGPRHRQGGEAGLRLPGQRSGASGGKPRLREHLLSGVWGVADPALGIERDPEQVERQGVPPLRADHSGGSGPLTCFLLCDKMGSRGTRSTRVLESYPRSLAYQNKKGTIS